MVVALAMSRYQGANLCCIFFREKEPPPTSDETLGILAFDAAKTMCRLVSLYNSLTNVEILRLRRHVIRSKGVAYLNSQQECFLLNLACAERLEDLNLAAGTVSSLARRCAADAGLSRFDAAYEDIKKGTVDVRKVEYGTKEMEKVIDKMERLVSSTRNLHMAMESLAEMEASERKIQRWKAIRSANHDLKVKVECFNDRIAYHRRQVHHYKQASLWSQSFDKVVGLMSRIICIVYARICFVFGPIITGCGTKNFKNLENSYSLLAHRDLYISNISLLKQTGESLKRRKGNTAHSLKKTGVIKFPHRSLPPHIVVGNDGADANKAVAKNNKVLRLAPPTTVGGAGLSQRYANVILFTERCMHGAAAIGEDARAALYDLLPERLRVKVRAKLRSQWLKWGENSEGGGNGHLAVAAQWRDTVEEVMEWLSPVAHDTVRWQAERNLEKQKFDTKPTVLLLQTLHYSDLGKVEEAIVELLVGLSCIYWYQKEW